MTRTNNPAEKIIVALDGMRPEEAIAFASNLTGLRWVKVGLELFVASGPEVLSIFRDKGLKIFLDLKFHDIPATVAGACRAAAGHGVDLITVHACSGHKALSVAKESVSEGAAENGFPTPLLLAVTVLTSWQESQFKKDLGISQPLLERVQDFAQLAKDAGFGGCVCSPLEVGILRSLHSYPFELVTPGIRFDNNDMEDQTRVMNPGAAIKAGATRIVIGRPITRALDPEKAFSRCCSEVDN